MPGSKETAYKYTIPLEEEDGVDAPVYEPSYNGELLLRRYAANSLVLVATESTPHFHKESVNVQVEEVPIEDYVDIEMLDFGGDGENGEDGTEENEGE